MSRSPLTSCMFRTCKNVSWAVMWVKSFISSFDNDLFWNAQWIVHFPHNSKYSTYSNISAYSGSQYSETRSWILWATVTGSYSTTRQGKKQIAGYWHLTFPFFVKLMVSFFWYHTIILIHWGLINQIAGFLWMMLRIWKSTLEAVNGYCDNMSPPQIF